MESIGVLIRPALEHRLGDSKSAGCPHLMLASLSSLREMPWPITSEAGVCSLWMLGIVRLRGGSSSRRTSSLWSRT